MCIGIPMQVLESYENYALCFGIGGERKVDTMLIGKQEIGTWVLVFINSAREVLQERDAFRINDAIKALDMVMQGKEVDSVAIDSLFPDLANRTPQLPMQSSIKHKI